MRLKGMSSYTDRIWLKRIILILIGNFLYGISTGLNATILPLLFDNYDVSRTLIGFLFAAEMASVFVVMPFLPFLTRKFGPPKILIATAIMRNTLLLIIPLVTSVELWLPLMFIFGTGSMTMFTIILFWVNSISVDHNRGFSIASVNLGLSLGVAVGPLTLSFLGIDDYLPFIVSSLVSFSSLIVYGLIFNSMPKSIGLPNKKTWAIIKTSAKPIIAGMFGDYIFFTMASFIVLFGISLGLSEIDAAKLITFMLAGGILVDLPVGVITDKYNKFAVLIIAAIVALISVQFLPQMAVKNEYSILVFVFIMGAMGASYVCALSLLGQKFTGPELLASNSIYVMFTTIGGMFGLVITGSLMEIYGHIGLVYSITFASVVFLIAILIVYLWERVCLDKMS
jgi:MFS family permease